MRTQTAMPAGCWPPGSRIGSRSAAVSLAAFGYPAVAVRDCRGPIRWQTRSLLAVAALEMKQAARIRMAARLDPEALPASRITEQVEVSFDSASGAVLARRRRRFGALVLSDRTEPADPVEVAGALARAVAADMLRPLPWTDQARQLQARVALMRRLEPAEAWPDLSDEALIAEIESWLAPHLAGLSRLGDVGRLELVGILRGLIPWNLVGRLERGTAGASRFTERAHRG